MRPDKSFATYLRNIVESANNRLVSSQHTSVYSVDALHNIAFGEFTPAEIEYNGVRDAIKSFFIQTTLVSPKERGPLVYNGRINMVYALTKYWLQGLDINQIIVPSSPVKTKIARNYIQQYPRIAVNFLSQEINIPTGQQLLHNLENARRQYRGMPTL